MKPSDVMVPQPEAASKTGPVLCDHCGLPVPAFRLITKSKTSNVFCCEGCRAVYQIISGCDLKAYYELKKQSASFAPSHPASSVQARYHYLDDPSIRQRFAYGKDGRAMDFYIEGVHCVACLWIIERIGSLVPGVENVQMNLGSLTAKVRITESGSFAAVAEGFEKIGYKPHPVTGTSEAGKLNKIENRRDMIRIGVAGFCMMNIMILFVSIYAGASASLLGLFRWLSGGLFLPIAFYSALPFYRGAMSSLKARQIHIDLPVAGAILLGSLASLYNLMIGSEHIYFDSLSAFVFLLLSARYLLKTIHQKTASQAAPGEFLVPKSALKYDASSKKTEVAAVENLKPGEWVKVPQGEVIAVDGEVAEGAGYADFHMISGESQPVKLVPGSPVYAGTVNVGSDLLIVVKAVGLQTRIERLLESVLSIEKPGMVQSADFAAKRYMAGVFVGSIILLFASRGLAFGAAFDRALSLIIIACPCALALATPLAYRMAWRECIRIGALLKGSATLDKMAAAKNLFLDKTGTLTYGRFEVLSWEAAEGHEMLAAEARALEKISAHPIAIAIRDYASRLAPDETQVTVEEACETLGKGVAGRIGGRLYEMKGIASPAADAGAVSIRSAVGIFVDGVLKVRIGLGDRIREDSFRALTELKRQFQHIVMITGDQKDAAASVAGQLQLSDYRAEVSPETKKELVEKDIHSLMIGDGANDAAAMKAAGVSVAVQGSIEASFQCSDVYLTVPGVGNLPELIAIARRTKSVIWTALSASLIYNFSGMALAIMGKVTPLIAAVAMPLSSFTVLAIAYTGLKWRRRLIWK